MICLYFLHNSFTSALYAKVAVSDNVVSKQILQDPGGFLMKIERLTQFAFVPLTAFALLLALLFVVGEPASALASSPTDWQQMHGNQPMTATMPMTETAPAVNAHQAHHGQAPNDVKGMMGELPMHHIGMGQQMAMMGRHLQMMGMMMQMMGHLHDMMDEMHGMMGDDMSMMHGMTGNGMMDCSMSMTPTMPMTDTMGTGMGMMGEEPMAMPMMDEMAPMHEMMSMMMEHMTAMLDEMKQMHHVGN